MHESSTQEKNSVQTKKEDGRGKASDDMQVVRLQAKVHKQLLKC